MPAGRAYGPTSSRGGRKRAGVKSAAHWSQGTVAPPIITPAATGGGKVSLVRINSAMPAGRRNRWPYG